MLQQFALFNCRVIIISWTRYYEPNIPVTVALPRKYVITKDGEELGKYLRTREHLMECVTGTDDDVSNRVSLQCHKTCCHLHF